MMRLVDADALKVKIEQSGGIGTIADYFKRVLANCLDNDAPTVDAVPVVHGRPVWINPLDPEAKICIWKCSSLCSVCGDYVAVGWKYCPNCGAKMDGERSDDDADD